jgi:NADH dehydrogenase [ubiquinone] 1 alpha subcomplex assembly factor 5
MSCFNGGVVHRSVLRRCFASSSGANVFDRVAKCAQRSRAAQRSDSRDFDYLRVEVAERLADRVLDVKDRRFERVLDLGAGTGPLLAPLQRSGRVGHVTMVDMSREALYRDEGRDAELTSGANSKFSVSRVVHDEETLLPNELVVPGQFDLVISSLSLHWVNDLPTLFERVRLALKPDGLFLGAMFGGDSLFELRSALLLAEQERRGGVGQHVSPFAGVGDIGNLLTRAHFALPAVDTERIVVRFGSMFALLRDLQGMGESNASHRRMASIPRDTLVAASAIYDEMYPAQPPPEAPHETGVEASFSIVYLSAWAPGEGQQQPAKRGSQTATFSQL